MRDMLRASSSRRKELVQNIYSGNMRVILASASPRRKELIKKIYGEYEVITSDVDENIEPCEPGKMVEQLSARKAKAVYEKVVNELSDETENILVIGADTIVYYDGEILGKPQDQTEAISMISMLSDRTHQVYTGVTLVYRKAGKESEISFYDKTDVTFYFIDKFDIAEYIKTGSPMDKAGAYGIQDEFSKHVKKIDGDYNTVVGFPVAKLYQVLKENKLV